MTFEFKLKKRWEVLWPSPHRNNTVPVLLGHKYEVKNGLTWRDVARKFPAQAERIRNMTSQQRVVPKQT